MKILQNSKFKYPQMRNELLCSHERTGEDHRVQSISLGQGLRVNVARSSASQDSLSPGTALRWKDHLGCQDRDSYTHGTQVPLAGALPREIPSLPLTDSAPECLESKNSPSPLPQEFHGATGPIKPHRAAVRIREINGGEACVTVLARSKCSVQLRYELLQ